MIRFEILVSLVATMIFSAILTPFVRKLAFKIGAVDKPNVRRVNKIPMPTMGGLAIFYFLYHWYDCAVSHAPVSQSHFFSHCSVGN